MIGTPFAQALSPVHRIGHATAEQAWNQAQLAQPVLEPRVGMWVVEKPAIIFGCAQKAMHAGAVEAGRSTCDLIIRRAGGGAVLTGPWMLTVSVVLPLDDVRLKAGFIGLYRWFGELHARALRQLEVPAEAISPVRRDCLPADPALDWACFGNLSPWELLAGGRKIVGLAQFHGRNGVLLTSGTLLHRPDWRLLTDALGYPEAAGERLRGRTAACDEFNAAPRLADAIGGLLMASLGDGLDPGGGASCEATIGHERARGAVPTV